MLHALKTDEGPKPHAFLDTVTYLFPKYYRWISTYLPVIYRLFWIEKHFPSPLEPEMSERFGFTQKRSIEFGEVKKVARYHTTQATTMSLVSMSYFKIFIVYYNIAKNLVDETIIYETHHVQEKHRNKR